MILLFLTPFVRHCNSYSSCFKLVPHPSLYFFVGVEELLNFKFFRLDLEGEIFILIKGNQTNENEMYIKEHV